MGRSTIVSLNGRGAASSEKRSSDGKVLRAGIADKGDIEAWDLLPLEGDTDALKAGLFRASEREGPFFMPACGLPSHLFFVFSCL